MYRSSTTLEDIYRLALPQDSHLLVGEELLVRAVSWACTLRPSPPAFPKLDGEELALIDMEDLRRLDPKMRLDRVVHSLQGAHITAIAVLGEVNDAAVRAASSHQIALLNLPDGYAISQIERDVIRLIVDRAGYIAQRSASLQRELNQIALDGRGLKHIADNIQSFIQQPIVLMREDGAIAATSGLESLSQNQFQTLINNLPNLTSLRSWLATQNKENVHTTSGILPMTGPAAQASLSRNRHGSNGSSPTVVAESQKSLTSRTTSASRISPLDLVDSSEVVVAPVVANDTVRGYFLIIRSPSEHGLTISSVEEVALMQGVAAVALEWAKQYAVDVAEERMRAAFVDELLASEIADEQAWIQRGASLGYDMSRPHVAWMIQARNVTDWPRSLMRFINELGVNAPMCRREEGTLLFWPIDNPTSGRELKSVASLLVERVQGQGANCELLVGIGRPGVGPADWHRSQQQARESWRLGKEWNRNAAVTYFGDLEFYQLLTALRGNQEAARFYRRTLGKLLTHDKDHNAELVTTLDAFFSCHGNLSQTATRLHIHRNTLTYRLERIAEITRLDLNDPDARFSLQLALKLQPIIQ
ncbi:MAG: helix-turn-helix domain-containing protein [Chloroflexota bacterium]